MTTAQTTARFMRLTAQQLADADLPDNPFAASDVLAAAKELGAAVVAYATKVRAERVKNAAVWAAYETAELDKTGATPPAPPPPPEPEPEPDPKPEPQPEPGGDQ